MLTQSSFFFYWWGASHEIEQLTAQLQMEDEEVANMWLVECFWSMGRLQLLTPHGV